MKRIAWCGLGNRDALRTFYPSETVVYSAEIVNSGEQLHFFNEGMATVVSQLILIHHLKSSPNLVVG